MQSSTKYEYLEYVRFCLAFPFPPGAKVISDWTLAGRSVQPTPFFFVPRCAECAPHIHDLIRSKKCSPLVSQVPELYGLYNYGCNYLDFEAVIIYAWEMSLQSVEIHSASVNVTESKERNMKVTAAAP